MSDLMFYIYTISMPIEKSFSVQFLMRKVKQVRILELYAKTVILKKEKKGKGKSTKNRWTVETVFTYKTYNSTIGYFHFHHAPRKLREFFFNIFVY